MDIDYDLDLTVQCDRCNTTISFDDIAHSTGNDVVCFGCAELRDL